MEILIDNQNNLIDLSEKVKTQIQKAIITCLEHLGYGFNYEISISILNKEEIRKLNREYRNNDSVTDVLSFPLFERDYIPKQGMLGDIVICVERVKEQAKDYNHSEERELIYLIVHSLLHLLGYDHIDEDDKFEMRTKEKEIMKKLGIFKNEKLR